MIRASLVRVALALLAASALSCARRPDFDIEKAHAELARAFEKKIDQVAIYEDGRGAVTEEWLIEFRVDGFGPFMQARFEGLDDRWALKEVRARPTGAEDTPWESVGVLLGRMKGEAVANATETLDRMRTLAEYIEQYAVRNANQFPQTDMAGLRSLLLSSGVAQEQDWRHDVDGWGQPFMYHASPDGLSYIVISKGADGNLDRPANEYFTNTDQGLEAYGGRGKDANADFIIASGDFVQGYEP